MTFSTKITSNDTITVNVKRTAPGFFAKIFGVKSVSVGATATARSEPVSQAFGVAPITVHYKQPLLHCTGGGNNIRCNPDFGPTHPTTLTLDDLHSSGGGNGAGAFGLINLDQNDNNPGANVLADWLLHGFNGYLPLGQYNSAPAANFNNSQFLSALQAMLGQQLLFPVYRVLKGPGSNALYDIIAWVGFVPTSYNASGSNGTITGYFTTYIADGVQVDLVRLRRSRRPQGGARQLTPPQEPHAMTYRVRNIGIALALAAIAALLTSVYVTSYKRHVQSGQDQVTVYVAKQDINRGTTGGEAAKLLSTQEVPKRTLVPGSITKPDQLTGLVATQPTLQGEQVTTRRFSTVSRNGVRAELTGTGPGAGVLGRPDPAARRNLAERRPRRPRRVARVRRKRGGLRVHARRPTQPEGAPGAGFARRGQLEADEQPGLHRHAQDDRQPVAEVPARPDGRRPRPHRELAPGAAPRHPRRRQPGEHHHHWTIFRDGLSPAWIKRYLRALKGGQ